MALVHFIVLVTIQKSNVRHVSNHKTPQINIKLNRPMHQRMSLRCVHREIKFDTQFIP